MVSASINLQKKWLDVKEAGLYFSISPKTLYSLAARKRLPEGSVLRIGRQIRIDVSVIEKGTALKGKK